MGVVLGAVSGFYSGGVVLGIMSGFYLVVVVVILVTVSDYVGCSGSLA